MRVYYFNIRNKFNLITFPKHGCTQICKYVSELNGYFDKHNHSYKHNKCDMYKKIHKCGVKMSDYNISLPTYIVIRNVNSRVLSYFLSNYKGELSFRQFVNKLEMFKKKDINHLGNIVMKLLKSGIQSDNAKFIYLEQFNKNFNKILEKFDLKLNLDKYIINNSEKHIRIIKKNIIIKNIII